MATNRYPDTCRWCGQPVLTGEGRLVQTADARQCTVPAHWRRGQCWHAVHADAPACVARARGEDSVMAAILLTEREAGLLDWAVEQRLPYDRSMLDRLIAVALEALDDAGVAVDLEASTVMPYRARWTPIIPALLAH